MESKRIGTFKEFLKGQKQKKVNESSVKLEIDWWDECIVEVMQDLETECNGVLDWDTLVKYVREKFSILGRDNSDYDEKILSEHIKDLIFQHHGKSFFCDGMCPYGDDKSKVHSMGLAIEELTKVILGKVMDKLITDDDPIPGVTAATLSDPEPKVMVPMQEISPYDPEDEYCDYMDEKRTVSHKGDRPVRKFKASARPVNETVAVIDCESYGACMDFCLGRLQEEVGSLNPEDLLKAAVDATDGKLKARLVAIYVKGIVMEYFTQGGKSMIVGLNGKKDVKKELPKDVVEKGLDVLCSEIADDILYKIAKENGAEDEEVK